MPYDRFPAVNENFDFPEEVRAQLAKSEQLRNMVTPMSESVRDNLTEDECWVGRTIFNTTSSVLESFTEANTWVTYLDSEAYVPEPPLPWDENYVVPEEVRIELAKSEQLRNMVIPMLESDRDDLTFIDRWNGRVIYNLTTESLETWNSNVGSWIKSLDETYVPPPKEWASWSPLLTYQGSTTVLSNHSAVGRYLIEGKLATVYFKIIFTGEINSSAVEVELRLTPPVQAESQASQIGTAIFDMASHGRVVGHVLLDSGENMKFMFDYMKADGYLSRVTNILPNPWVADCTIEGQITYEIGD